MDIDANLQPIDHEAQKRVQENFAAVTGGFIAILLVIVIPFCFFASSKKSLEEYPWQVTNLRTGESFNVTDNGVTPWLWNKNFRIEKRQ